MEEVFGRAETELPAASLHTAPAVQDPRSPAALSASATQDTLAPDIAEAHPKPGSGISWVLKQLTDLKQMVASRRLTSLQSTRALSA